MPKKPEHWLIQKLFFLRWIILYFVLLTMFLITIPMPTQVAYKHRLFINWIILFIFIACTVIVVAFTARDRGGDNISEGHDDRDIINNVIFSGRSRGEDLV